MQGELDADFTGKYSITYSDQLKFDDHIDNILAEISQYDYCICTNYILSWVANVPFVSISTTDKVKFLMRDLTLLFPVQKLLIYCFNDIVYHRVEVKKNTRGMSIMKKISINL